MLVNQELNADYNWLYISLETKVRELYPKLLLSCFAAEAGFKVVIGKNTQVESHILDMPIGIFLDKDPNYGKMARFQKIFEKGHKIVVQDEEFSIYRSDSQLFIDRILKDETFDILERVFTWGNIDTEIIKSMLPNVSDKITQTGSPRIDILRPEFIPIFADDANNIKKRYGQFILINTNFGYNHYLGTSYGEAQLKEKLEKYGNEMETIWKENLSLEKETFQQFIKMIQSLSKAFPAHTVIIRPHPSENHEVWRNLMSDQSNVCVIHEGSVIPWIFAADAMIHNRCTTGIESYVMNTTPTFAFCPIESTKFDMYVPNDLSIKVDSIADLVDKLDKVLRKNNITQANLIESDKKTIADRHLDSLDGMYACERIVSELIDINKSMVLSMTNNALQSDGTDSPIQFLTLISTIVNTLKKKMFTNKQRMNYNKQKFIGLKLEEIEDCIGKFQLVSGRFGSIRVKKIDEDLFEIWNSN
ncbi:surface carbohydrate biosynthesis protein [Methanoplanus endosymbiosus]|uniref:Surface carbohydrate biosynthesis protein n=1 Tax=Methanoplanus endosymbiosus TaxID=33865 RepID=A0A9E7TJX2_9EURY|nr:surface carbohydrate biosynthesis protein [Methanoplanus endosymbiosus]UUX92249.1 hypothetical protein L6E24_12995 [Methanoplanus endosymbiosus]